MIPEAKNLTKGLPKELKVTIARIYDYLVTERRCVPDVKTIYISFTMHEKMVAAIYMSKLGLEIALALPEDHASTLLEDASHLTWKTLPLLVPVRLGDELGPVLSLIQEAVERVEMGIHSVDRPSEFFVERPRKGWSR